MSPYTHEKALIFQANEKSPHLRPNSFAKPPFLPAVRIMLSACPNVLFSVAGNCAGVYLSALNSRLNFGCGPYFSSLAASVVRYSRLCWHIGPDLSLFCLSLQEPSSESSVCSS